MRTQAVDGRAQRGSVSIEAMILVPLMLSVLILIVEASLWVYACSVAQAAAEDGARAGAGLSVSSAQGGIDAAQRILESRPSALNGWNVSATSDAQWLTVRVEGRSPTVIPGVSFAVAESATLPWEVR